VGRLCTREKYLRIKGNAHELPCDISALLLGEFKSVGLRKEEDRGEGEFRAPDKITSLIIVAISLSISKFFIIAALSINILFIFNSRIF
jgi:hypothetical protein